MTTHTAYVNNKKKATLRWLKKYPNQILFFNDFDDF